MTQPLANDVIVAELEKLAVRLLAPPRWRFWKRADRATIVNRLKRKSLARDTARDTLKMWLTELQAESPWSIDQIMGAREVVKR